MPSLSPGQKQICLILDDELYGRLKDIAPQNKMSAFCRHALTSVVNQLDRQLTPQNQNAD